MGRTERKTRSPYRGVIAAPVKSSLGQQVYEQLKNAVVRGDLPPGHRVVESQLAGAFGISRTPIREAIHKLERAGHLRRSPSGGFFVAGLNREDIVETFGIRSVLESYAAALAAQRHRPADLQPLEKEIELYQRSLEQGRLGALPRINTRFHDLLYDLSGSPRLIHMIHDLGDSIYRFRKMLLESPEMARISNQDHRRMLTFIRKRDAAGVESIVREHIERGKRAVLKQFDSNTRITQPAKE